MPVRRQPPAAAVNGDRPANRPCTARRNLLSWRRTRPGRPAYGNDRHECRTTPPLRAASGAAAGRCRSGRPRRDRHVRRRRVSLPDAAGRQTVGASRLSVDVPLAGHDRLRAEQHRAGRLLSARRDRPGRPAAPGGDLHAHPRRRFRAGRDNQFVFGLARHPGIDVQAALLRRARTAGRTRGAGQGPRTVRRGNRPGPGRTSRRSS